MTYCRKKNYYPESIFIKAWGCDDYKPKYVDLLEKEE